MDNMIYIKIDNDTFYDDAIVLVRSFYPRMEVKAYKQDTVVTEDDKVIDITVPDMTGLNKSEMHDKFKSYLYDRLSQMTGKTLPWGYLTGVRPSKIAYVMLEDGEDEQTIKKHFVNKHKASEKKASLAINVAKKEMDILNKIDYKNGYSLYIGIPFCRTRCYYCSFPANPLKQFGHLRMEYVQKLIEEVKGMAKILKDTNKEIETLYIGGGTPTALEKEELDILITALYKELDLSKIKEFTVEAGRPDSITRGKLEVLKKHNVSRISINPQTMNDETLEKIGRAHSVSDIVDCFNMAREIGFDNINMDLILGLVDEDLEMVRNTLEEIKKLNPESLTVHTLAVKRASKLKEDIENYELTRYEEMIKMIDLSMEYAKEMGLNPYYMYRQKHMLGNLENIGYAKEGYECIYNIQIMEEKQSNYALGAGSISKFVYVDEDRIERVENVKNVEQYIDRVDEMIERKRKEIYQNVN